MDPVGYLEEGPSVDPCMVLGDALEGRRPYEGASGEAGRSRTWVACRPSFREAVSVEKTSSIANNYPDFFRLYSSTF